MLFYSKGEKLFLIPKGEFLPYGGGIDIEPVLEVTLPVEKEILKQKTVTGWTKGSVIGDYLKIKSFKKIVQQFDYFSLIYFSVEKKYELRKLLKAPDFKYYSGGESVEMGSVIDFDFIMNLVSG